MEISLFSGYELFSVSSMPSDAEGNISDLQHGSHANNLWFVFANVTSKCPICVQYIIRSAYVISSLRPAFARVYPAAREDLAAETFFHSQPGSELLAGITEDDLITWFGKNDTRNSTELDNQPECRHNYVTSTADTLSTTLTSQTTTDDYNFETTSPFTATPEVNPLEELSVTTYTINVDNNSIFNNISKPLSATQNLVKQIMVANVTHLQINNTNGNITMPTIATRLNKTLPHIVNNVKLNKTQMIAVITKSKIILNKKPENITKANFAKVSITQKASHLKSIKLKNLKNKTKYAMPRNLTITKANITAKVNQSEVSHEQQMITKVPVTTTTEFVPTKVPIMHHEIKHINTEIHQVPVEYLNESKTESDEEKPSTFLPENKDDKFLVLDKDALWGMLKEVVHDELDKKEKSKEADGRKLRNQGFT